MNLDIYVQKGIECMRWCLNNLSFLNDLKHDQCSFESFKFNPDISLLITGASIDNKREIFYRFKWSERK